HGRGRSPSGPRRRRGACGDPRTHRLPRPRSRARWRRRHGPAHGRRRQRAGGGPRRALMRGRLAAFALLLACCPGARADGDGGSSPFEVLVFADPQPRTAMDVDYYRRDIVEPLVGRQHAKLGISLGDIAGDDPALYPAIKATDATLGLPWL